MAAYHLSYQTSAGRCAWCWEPLPAAEPHAVVTAQRPPHLELHFHPTCWDGYRSVSGVEFGAVGSSRDWPPERIESLRITTGLTVQIFAKELGVTESTYRRILSGDETAFGPGVRIRLRRFAAVNRFESNGGIDWSDGRSVFCLRMHLRLRKGAFARTIDASDQQITHWESTGVPVRSVRTWSRLSKLAAKAEFGAGDVLDDRLWTAERLARAIEESGRSRHVWGAAAGFSAGAVQQWASGTRPIHREAAWGLTRAAVELGAELPPVGLVEAKKGVWSVERKPLSAEDEARRIEALREAKWTLEQLRELGTVPDRELARRFGRTRNSVAIMRRALEIPGVDARYWDGAVLPQRIGDDELVLRWDAAKEAFKRKKTGVESGHES